MSVSKQHLFQASAASVSGRRRGRRVSRVTDAGASAALIACTSITVLTTFSIVFVLFNETRQFFQMDEVSFGKFFFDLRWSPLLGGEKHFGIWPLINGTLLVTAVAAAVALPMGLMTAIYLSEYAKPRVRAMLKPTLEVLAGVPTVVYGFFALMVITPSLQAINDGFGVYNALSAGIAVGVMCLPIVSSLSEDALRAVPTTLREAAYAVGATRFDVAVKVVTPAALSGVLASFLLAIARAVGETMIVSLAAGNAAKLTIDPRVEVQTMTAYIVQIFLGDASSVGVEYLSSYAVAATLFTLTLLLTLLGASVLKRYRQVYE